MPNMADIQFATRLQPAPRYTIAQLLRLANKPQKPFDLARFTYAAARGELRNLLTVKSTRY